MAKPRRIGDTERTAQMIDALRRSVVIEAAGAESAIILEEVPSSASWITASADALVYHFWKSKSNGRTLDGYELKASRADLKRELADPQKCAALSQYCETWTLLVYDEAVIAGFDIPEGWGITVTEPASDDMDGPRRVLKVVRRPTETEARPWPRKFISALVRRAHHQAPAAAYIARCCEEARALGLRDGKDTGTQRERTRWRELLTAALGERCPTGRFGAPADDDLVAAVKAAATLAQQGALPMDLCTIGKEATP